jgi:hypothetical protein
MDLHKLLCNLLSHFKYLIYMITLRLRHSRTPKYKIRFYHRRNTINLSISKFRCKRNYQRLNHFSQINLKIIQALFIALIKVKILLWRSYCTLNLAMATSQSKTNKNLPILCKLLLEIIKNTRVHFSLIKLPFN